MYPPHDLRGGYEATWRAAVGHLRERGHDVRVLTTDHRAPEAAGEPEDPGVHRELRWYWRDHAFPRRGWRERVALERHNAAVLDRHLGEHRPDVVNWWAMGGMSLGLVERVRRAGLPAVGVVGDEWMAWGPRMDAWLRPLRSRPRLAAAAERLTGLPARVELGSAATWLFNSDHTRRASAAAGWTFARGEVAHPGVDASLFRAAPAREWGWRVLYVGRLDPRKGVDTAVEAMAHLPAEATLTLQGSGDPGYVADLRARVRELGLEERVRLGAEPRERLGEVYAGHDAVAFPVRWEEPWGLVPLEAMTVGRPVVATGTGGSAEYLRDGENCLLFEPRDSAAALARALSRLAGDRALRERLREGGLRTAAPFTEAAYNEAIAAAIEAAAAAPRPRAPLA
ncbi:MAG TPA: glycosyltransferase family 4 protein [Thermoleophilaceae bacterium]|jgi:glycosyltransferase involved in cell wall biosynthesis